MLENEQQTFHCAPQKRLPSQVHTRDVNLTDGRQSTTEGLCTVGENCSVPHSEHEKKWKSRSQTRKPSQRKSMGRSFSGRKRPTALFHTHEGIVRQTESSITGNVSIFQIHKCQYWVTHVHVFTRKDKPSTSSMDKSDPNQMRDSSTIAIVAIAERNGKRADTRWFIAQQARCKTKTEEFSCKEEKSMYARRLIQSEIPRKNPLATAPPASTSIFPVGWSTCAPRLSSSGLLAHVSAPPLVRPFTWPVA